MKERKERDRKPFANHYLEGGGGNQNNCKRAVADNDRERREREEREEGVESGRERESEPNT